MLHEQQLKHAVMAAGASMHIKTIYTRPGIEPGTSCTESRCSTTELWRHVNIQQLDMYLLKTAYKGALIKHLLSAASNHKFIQLLSEVAF